MTAFELHITKYITIHVYITILYIYLGCDRRSNPYSPPSLTAKSLFTRPIHPESPPGYVRCREKFARSLLHLFHDSFSDSGGNEWERKDSFSVTLSSLSFISFSTISDAKGEKALPPEGLLPPSRILAAT